MSGYAETDGVLCECGVIAAHHLDCGDPCCPRCVHPDYTPGARWIHRKLGMAENDQPALPEDNGGVVASGLPPRESALKRRALPEVIAELDDVRDWR